MRAQAEIKKREGGRIEDSRRLSCIAKGVVGS